MTIPENVIPLINIGLAVWLLVSMAIGYKKGFVWEILSILGVLVAIFIAWIIAPGIAEIIKVFPESAAPFKGTSVGAIVYNRLNYIVWFIIITIAILIILALLKPLFNAITELPVLKQINGIFGARFSGIKTMVFFVLLVYVCNSAVISNGKDIIETTRLKYVQMASQKTMSIVSRSFSENVAIQKMLSDPLSLTQEDLQSIVSWLNKSKLSADQISEFLIKYGIDPDKVNGLIKNIGKRNG